MALCRAVLMPAREVEAFLATMRLPTDFMDGSTLFANGEGGKDHGVGDCIGCSTSLKNFNKNGNVKGIDVDGRRVEKSLQ